MKRIVGKYSIMDIKRPTYQTTVSDTMAEIAVPVLNRNLSYVLLYEDGYAWPFFSPSHAVLLCTAQMYGRVNSGTSFDAEGLLIADEDNYDLDACRWLISSLTVHDEGT